MPSLRCAPQGYIEFDEFDTMTSKLGLFDGVPEEEAAQTLANAFAIADTSGDGKVHFDEFVELFAAGDLRPPQIKQARNSKPAEAASPAKGKGEKQKSKKEVKSSGYGTINTKAGGRASPNKAAQPLSGSKARVAPE